jgi:hypothetical protein
MKNFSRELLIGQWYRGESDEYGNLISEYADIAADGSFEFTFIYHDSEGVITKQLIELGDWGLVGNIHFTMTKSEFDNDEHFAVDLADPDNYHAYQVLELNSQVFTYQHVVSEEIYTLRRVLGDVGYC